jgi:AcrR family transcriptional regulator
MERLQKGFATRTSIIDQSREIMNTRGIGLTIDAIAREMGVSKSRISNHFPTKETLFLAILKEYERELGEVIAPLQQKEDGKSFEGHMALISAAMDLQFKYRCAIIYLNLLSPSQHETIVHINSTFERNKHTMRKRTELMVANKLLNPMILDEPYWSSFVFMYVNSMTQWVIYVNMYDAETGYERNKNKYLRGILFHLYFPHITKKGRLNLEQILEEM